MKKILGELWDLYFESTTNTRSDEEQKILDTLIEQEELLNKNLCNEMKEALKIYDNCLNDLWHIGEKKAFVAGIKFATKYMIEMTQKDNF
ncbi:MAG: hypothetical protein J6D20_00195 [Clostridia bacterium]|nr:hypothetical protein [Clostridia bacterium]